MKIGLALSGGGMRGLAHIGVLQALEENKIKPEFISGASAGALIGAVYAAGYSPAEMLEIAKDLSFTGLLKAKFSLQGFSALDGIETVLNELIPENNFKALKIPLYVALTDLLHGRTVIKSEGELFKTVKASCSIPILTKPVYIDDIAYADGGIMNNLPAEAIKGKVDNLIGVNLMPNPTVESDKLSSMMQLAIRTFELSLYENSHNSLKLCDIKIEPMELAGISILKHKDVKEVYDIGYNSALKVLEKLYAEN